jgi:hypothetical protein
MARTPYPPIVERPLPDKFGRGMSWLERWPATGEFDHSMVGWLWSTDAYFRLVSTLASTDYGIGGLGDGASDGVIVRWINYHERRNTAGWASGWANAPDTTQLGQAYLDTFGVKAVNGGGRSIELSGLVATPITSKQWTSLIHLSAAIHHRELEQGYEEYGWHLEHADVAEKDCAFQRWRQHRDQLKYAVKRVMERYETGRDIEDFLMFGDTKVWLPGGADIVTPQQPPEKPIFVDFGRNVYFHTVKGAVSRQWGFVPDEDHEGDNPIVRRYPEGTKLRTVGYYHGEEVNGDDRWLVIASRGPSNNARIHSSGVKEKIPDPGTLE